MLSPITAASLAGLRQLADKMEKILLVALDRYGNTLVEPKVELGARFGHLVRKYHFLARISHLQTQLTNPFHSPIPGHLSSYPGVEHRLDQSKAAN